MSSAFNAVKGSFDYLTRTYFEYSQFIHQNAAKLGLPQQMAVGDVPLSYPYNRYNPFFRDSAEANPEPPLNKRRKTNRPYKKRDPNAPKRPLTSFFLFLKHARPVIKADLQEQTGQTVNHKTISEEATRRFKGLSQEERAVRDPISYC